MFSIKLHVSDLIEIKSVNDLKSITSNGLGSKRIRATKTLTGLQDKKSTFS